VRVASERAMTEVPLVVLIEDDPLVRLGQEMLLRDWGYRVVLGASGEEVRAALRDAPGSVAAIVTDFSVDGAESGAEVALAIAAAAGRPIPTAVMSGSLGRTSGAAAQEHGFTFFAKPVDPEQLRGWLAAAVVGPR
jgi:two-component system, sensor histidine kinase